MFGLFGKTVPAVSVIDKVWMSKQAKHNACIQMLHINPNCLFITWFDETYAELLQVLNLSEPNTSVLRENETEIANTQNRMVVFAEHYPLSKTEQASYARLNLKDVPVLSSLDEPFFQWFGGDKTIDLMKKLGMKEDEVIGHSLVTRSIRNAQKKIERSVVSDMKASSQEKWFAINMK